MNFGFLLILFALPVSIASLVLYARGARREGRLLTAARWTFISSGLCLAAAAVLLAAAFLGHRYQFAYVYSHSSAALPLLYLVSAFWAGQEGTFLLWALLLSGIGIAVISSRDRDEPVILSLIVITQIFLIFFLVLHSPFRYVWQAHPDMFHPGDIPADGTGLNPLLQDVWMAIHPPVLFLGYAAAVVPFARAAASLVRDDYSDFARAARPWVIFSVVSLGAGIFFGGYWAYKVLGWGGYWGWDPVENSSLIPWLVLIALAHGLVVQRKKGALVKTNLVLSLLAFILILYSTFLTRSGVLSDFSVHSFSDLGFSRHLVFFMLFYVIVAAFLFLKRLRAIPSGPLSREGLAWDALTVYGIVALICYAFLILVGTSMPILSGLFSKNAFSVHTDYYVNVSIPLGVLILSFAVCACLMQFPRALKGALLWGLAAAALAAGILFNVFHTSSAAAYVCSTLAVFLFCVQIRDLASFHSRQILPSRLAHAGVAVLVLGIVSSSLHSTSAQRRCTIGKAEKIGDIALTFEGLTGEEKKALRFSLDYGGRVRRVETPYYLDSRTRSLFREPFIAGGLIEDLYISPVDYQSGIESITRVHLKKGERRRMGGLTVGFSGFEVDRARMMAGHAKLFAKLLVLSGGRSTAVNPGQEFTAEGRRRQIDAVVPFTGQRVSLLDFNVSDGEALIFVEAPRGVPAPPDSALVEVSFKRFISLVWLGTALIVLGGLAGLIPGRQKK